MLVTCDTCPGEDAGDKADQVAVGEVCAKLLPPELLGDAGKPCTRKRRNKIGSFAAAPALGS